MYAMQDYIDAQFGGPGKGFYRIVQEPVPGPQGDQRREDGGGHGHRDQRAVRLHDEARRPGLRASPTSTASSTRCTSSASARWSWSTSSTTRCPASPATTARSASLVNAANFLETGSFWDMRHCEPADGESHDKNQVAAPDISAGQQDALFGAIAQLGLPERRAAGLPAAGPLQQRAASPRSASTRSRRWPKRHMIFDPDHMSVKARQLGARHDRRARLPRRPLLALVGDARRLPADLRGGRLHRAVRRRLDRLRREVAHATSAGRTRATTSASASAPT